ncbi:matrixin family metalloprotease [Algoriphagus aestuariicola]|uniref:Matrixin family metalloprotease n=1 Tax=Algoriphagus aestuariicola TaxID=1852016 RepID=A0ABS3BLJ6_9BACT|nr:matrixin family metalloprotease [Algoriphagus aestuariicola]MBN7800170.1 matrixin family metalloprotease [Algoriphagus aestuariicola]
MVRGYLDKDFFLSIDGEDLFEMKAPEKIKHRCVTDEAVVIENGNVPSSSDKGGRPFELVVGLGNHIPLWEQNVTLKWRLNSLFDTYTNSDNVKDYIRELVKDALSQWGDASPVKFEESSADCDFEVIMRPDDCDINGCTLASAFFPNSNLNILTLYPKMFTQSKFEQVETLIHEIGHIFGLRHYFAKDRESSWRSEIFGHHYPLTIMNYGHQSTITEQDRIDLKRLYSSVWSGKLSEINGLKIELFKSLTLKT